jgi:hypothetical protein
MKESQHIEYKESWRDEYLKWICGFANAEGGVLIIGRNDKGAITGLTNAEKLLEDIPNKVRDILGIMVEVNLHEQASSKNYPENYPENPGYACCKPDVQSPGNCKKPGRYFRKWRKISPGKAEGIGPHPPHRSGQRRTLGGIEMSSIGQPERERFFVQRMKTKWGSCSPAVKGIRLNTELAKKQRECLEYIVVHEMVHLLEPTHNSRFLAFMDRFMPKWQQYRELLNRLPVHHAQWRY